MLKHGRKIEKLLNIPPISWIRTVSLETDRRRRRHGGRTPVLQIRGWKMPIVHSAAAPFFLFHLFSRGRMEEKCGKRVSQGLKENALCPAFLTGRHSIVSLSRAPLGWKITRVPAWQMRKGRMTAANCQLKRHFSWRRLADHFSTVASECIWTSAYSTIRGERLDVENLVRPIVLQRDHEGVNCSKGTRFKCSIVPF